MIIQHHADFPNRFIATADFFDQETMMIALFSTLIAAAAVQAPTVFRYPAKAALIPLVIGAIVVIVGLFIRRTGVKKFVSWGIIGFGVVVGGLITSMVYGERVIVSDTELVNTTGLPFAGARRTLPFDTIHSIRFTTDRVGRRQREIVLWEVRYRDGSVEEINPSDLWENNTGEIRAIMESHGVVFLD
jgi:hypothetical protein